jgi:bifunctional DNA-binding transcriptional regulator/antitoxin component of YhaV-PrlF toxin-antitoxin module
MSAINKIQIRSKGNLTLPMELRRKYDIDEGDIITLIDLGNGSFLLTPFVSQVDRLGNRVSKAMEEAGVSEDELLRALEEERENYYKGRYVES